MILKLTEQDRTRLRALGVDPNDYERDTYIEFCRCKTEAAERDLRRAKRVNWLYFAVGAIWATLLVSFCWWWHGR